MSFICFVVLVLFLIIALMAYALGEDHEITLTHAGPSSGLTEPIVIFVGQTDTVETLKEKRGDERRKVEDQQQEQRKQQVYLCYHQKIRLHLPLLVQACFKRLFVVGV